MRIVNAVRAESPVKIDPYSRFSTQPYHVWCDCNDVFIVKFLQNPEGNLALVNEFVCYKLAVMLDLPIAEAALVYVDEDFVSLYGEEISLHLENEIQTGLHFGSKKLPRISPITTHKIIENTTNVSQVPNILLFDQLIANSDRDANKGNLLYDMVNNKVVIIDHSHVFKLGAIWNNIELRRMIGEPFEVYHFQGTNFSKLAYFVKGHNPFADILHRMESIKHEDIRNIINGIPDEWGISRDDKDALTEFLCDRLSRIKEALVPLAAVLPYWKGGVT